MKSRFALMLIALLPLFAACSKQANEAATPAVETVAAPATTAPADVAPAAEAATTTETPAAAPVAATPPSGPAPVAGTDYAVIAGGQPFDPLNGKIEVVEIFGYTCPHCASCS